MKLIKKRGWRTVCVRDLPQIIGAEPLFNTVVITFDDGYLDTFEYGFGILRSLDMKATWYIVTGSIGKTADWIDSAPEKGFIMNWEHMREMNRAGMEIGSHSRSHLRLTTLSKQDRESELHLSAITIAIQLNL
jgi:peptidoglycan/xylan/chitin deacetylase (PgdA/CDA1 family)